ncbi:hypothetical protein PSI22_19980 [Xenorhabdus sp. XENO-7]|uniref:Uncharacterized protein n=1 Tax=Xenorhabdus aichiensis TaxID=3025874 RepID=A0ABT5M9W8_9GAMM|nr:hypothetical protein [Xenorhabdus aichiensis]MDC9623850.1 hypothetical protein [Xenorhabdus aichiensis]
MILSIFKYRFPFPNGHKKRLRVSLCDFFSLNTSANLKSKNRSKSFSGRFTVIQKSDRKVRKTDFIS